MKVGLSFLSLSALIAAGSAQDSDQPAECKGKGWGDPHIMTFDGTKFDAQPRAEIIMSTSLDDPGFMIQSRSTPINRGKARQVTVTSGVAAREKADGPVVQLSMTANITESTFSMNDCPMALYINSELVSEFPEEGIKSDHYQVTTKPGKSKIILQFEKMRMVLKNRHNVEFNVCMFNVDYFLEDGCRSDERLVGVLGSPDGDPLNDWTDREGNVYDFPNTTKKLLREPAYDYVKENWCITEASESIFTYGEGESHAFYEHCTDKYEPIDCEVTPEIHEKCKGDLTCELEVCIMGEEELEEIENDEDCTGKQPDVVEEFMVEEEEDENPEPIKPGTNGDPHFKTWKNEHFEYHGQCDMVLVKDEDFANGLGLEVQIRTKIIRYWSYIKNAAIRIGEDILEIEGGLETDSENHYWFNMEYQGKLDKIGGFPVSSHMQSDFKHRFEIDLSSKYPGHKIVLSTFKEFVRVDFLNGSEEAFGKTVGLLGDFSTGKTLARDGSTVIDDFWMYGNEWQVLPYEHMLFHETSAPQFPERCIMPEDPRGERRRRLAESSISEEEAEAACAQLKDALDRKDCVYDILATQDLAMVGAY